MYASGMQQISISDDADDVLTVAEVARIFKVDPKTVARWAKVGRLSSTRTLGGHRRFSRTECEELLNATRQVRR